MIMMIVIINFIILYKTKSSLYFILFYFQVWTHPGWIPLKTLAGHEQKVSCVDISPGELKIDSPFSTSGEGKVCTSD